MALHIEDYAFITEFLCGGYTYKGVGVRQCSKKFNYYLSRIITLNLLNTEII